MLVKQKQLYGLLENDIIPCFYERDSKGIPRSWVARMRASMAELTPQFSANRMVREYVDKLYSVCRKELSKAYCQWSSGGGALVSLARLAHGVLA